MLVLDDSSLANIVNGNNVSSLDEKRAIKKRANSIDSLILKLDMSKIHEIDPNDSNVEALLHDINSNSYLFEKGSAKYITDNKGFIYKANQAFADLAGKTVEELKTINIAELFSKDYEVFIEKARAKIIEGSDLDFEGYLTTSDGNELFGKINSYGYFHHGEYIGSFTMFQDETKYKKMHQSLINITAELSDANEQLEISLENQSNISAKLYDTNEKLETSLKNQSNITAELSDANEELQASLENQSNTMNALRLRTLKDKVDAIIDSTTGLPNRNTFNKFYNLKQKAGKLNDDFNFYDINYFKLVNDVAGHLAGDYVLNDISNTLKKRSPFESTFERFQYIKSAKSIDEIMQDDINILENFDEYLVNLPSLIARFGGDEFISYNNNISVNNPILVELTKEVLDEIKTKDTIKDYKLHIMDYVNAKKLYKETFLTDDSYDKSKCELEFTDDTLNNDNASLTLQIILSKGTASDVQFADEAMYGDKQALHKMYPARIRSGRFGDKMKPYCIKNKIKSVLDSVINYFTPMQS